VSLLAIAIHDPDVVFTDLGLALLGGWFAWRLGRHSQTGRLGRTGAVLMAGLASAALWGAVFHAFFPANTTTLPGRIAWIPVSLSIVVAAAALLELGLCVLAAGLDTRVRHWIVGVYAVAFAGMALADDSFAGIVRFYVPALLLFLIGATVWAIRKGGGWIPVALGLAFSAVAAVLQQAGVAVHPVYFDHNAVYHIVQAAALVLLYLGFRRVSETTAPTLER
jgi:hypothetical protein